MRFQPLGDSAILIRIGDDSSAATLQRVRDVLHALDASPPPGVVDIVPAYDSIAVFHDRTGALESPETAFDSVCSELYDCIAAATGHVVAHEDERLIEIPVRYGGAHGPDLAHVAEHAGITTDRVVELHSGAEYTVAMIGFAPGFPYLSGLHPELATPRRPTPRSRVPAGSVGIAGLQTGIYPLSTPGGWQLIGRTETKLFDVNAKPPTLLRVGDRIRFRVVA